MNIKNNKGVTLTALIVTLIVLSILFSITFTTSLNLLKNSQRKKMKTMLYMVKSRAEILLDDYLFEHDGELDRVRNDDIQKELGGDYLVTIEAVQVVGYELDSNEIPTRDIVIYCGWDENELKKQGIDTKNLAEGDTIIIQYNIYNETVDVASTKGFRSNGTAIHSLRNF